jgi:hypothetical protein
MRIGFHRKDPGVIASGNEYAYVLTIRGECMNTKNRNSTGTPHSHILLL